MRYIIIILLSTLITACSETPPAVTSLAEDSPESNLIIISEQQFTASDFQLGKPSLSTFDKFLKVTGTVYLPENSKASVSTLMPGTVGPMRLAPGQWVQKGQVLFRVTNPELINLQQEYLIAVESIQLLRGEYERQQELATANISLKKDLLAVQTSLRTTEVKVAALGEKLKLYGINPEQLTINEVTSNINIVAPISGYVSEIHANEGMYLESGITALDIKNTNGMQLHLNVLEKDWAYLKKDQSVRFSIQGNPNSSFQTRIRTIQQIIDEDQMIPVYCSINEQAKKSLAPGMFVTAEIVTSGTEAISLPEEAVVKLDGQQFILKLANKENGQLQFEKIQIEEQSRQRGMVNLGKTNLALDDQFLVKGAYYIVSE